MNTNYVPIYYEWLEVTQDLSAEEKGNLIDAVVSYASGAEYEHYLSGSCKVAFRFLKGQVDRNAEISSIRAQARKGRRGDQQEETNDNKRQQTETNDNTTQQAETNFPKKKNKEINNIYNINNINNTNNKKEKEIVKEKAHTEPPKRFTPPTVEDVRAYCQERGNDVDPERFVDFYASKGWKVGNQPMKDWRAAVRTWERGNANGGGGKSAGPGHGEMRPDYTALCDTVYV